MQAHELDAVLQQQYPLHIVGLHEPFEPLREPGSRLLLTGNGLLLEACNGVHHSVQPLAQTNTDIVLPYGHVQCGTTVLDPITADALPGHINAFAQAARRASPMETIMLVVKATGQPARCVYPQRSATRCRVEYDFADLREGEHIILDIHSHGAAPAFFSPEDDANDTTFRGNLKIAYVIGSMDQSMMTYTRRWVARGHIFDRQSELREIAVPGAPAC